MSLTTVPSASSPVLMPPAATGSPQPPLPSYFSHLFQLTVEQYDRMTEVGILGEDDRVELIEGVLVAKMGRNRPHIVSGKKSLRTLEAAVPPGWHVSKEDPLRVSDFSKPEPDITVVRGIAEDYLHRDVTAADIAMAAEISESTLRFDQQDKKPIYAASGIPIYWIINLVDDRLEVCSDPDGREYRTVQIFMREQEVPLVIGGAEVARIRVADLLP